MPMLEASTRGLEEAPRPSAYHLDFSGDGWRTPELLQGWDQLLNGRCNPDGLYQTPDFFEHLHALGAEQKKLSLMTVRGADGSLAGVVPLRVTRASLSFDVSHRVLGAVNVSAVEVLGSQPLIPSTSTHHDRLFSTIIGAFPGCHAITMRNVPTDSFLWRHCHESKVLRSQFIVYVPYGKRHCHTIPLPATFEEYLTQFSAKKRYNLRRQVRRLHTHARGAVELRRIEAPNDVTALIDAVETLRRGSRSDSTHAHTGQLPEIDPDAFADLARRDMLLGYVLLCEGRPCAAAVGVKYGRTYQMGSPMAAYILKGHDRMIHDESMAAFSPGTVLLFLFIEDLISRGYQLIDLGYGEPAYRHSSTNLVVERGTILLLRRTFSNSVYHVGHAAFRAGVGHAAFRAGISIVKSLRQALSRRDTHVQSSHLFPILSPTAGWFSTLLST